MSISMHVLRIYCSEHLLEVHVSAEGQKTELCRVGLEVFPRDRSIQLTVLLCRELFQVYCLIRPHKVRRVFRNHGSSPSARRQGQLRQRREPPFHRDAKAFEQLQLLILVPDASQLVRRLLEVHLWEQLCWGQSERSQGLWKRLLRCRHVLVTRASDVKIPTPHNTANLYVEVTNIRCVSSESAKKNGPTSTW